MRGARNEKHKKGDGAFISTTPESNFEPLLHRVPFLKRTRALSCIQEFVFREVYSYFFGILYLACILRQ